MKRQLIESGEIPIGEPIVPVDYEVVKVDSNGKSVSHCDDKYMRSDISQTLHSANIMYHLCYGLSLFGTLFHNTSVMVSTRFTIPTVSHIWLMDWIILCHNLGPNTENERNKAPTLLNPLKGIWKVLWVHKIQWFQNVYSFGISAGIVDAILVFV